MVVFDETIIEKLPPYCKKTYNKLVKEIDNHEFDDFAIYTAKNILYNAITHQSEMSFMVALNEGLRTYLNSDNRTEEQVTNMKLLISDWTLIHSNAIH